mmetsp:Transcript_6157/g.16117  ORF Transcript_6157/g.16117 Transcript_6157/m.16117 type:complete len:249 (+) Transcript_6157:169-915(+)
MVRCTRPLGAARSRQRGQCHRRTPHLPAVDASPYSARCRSPARCRCRAAPMPSEASAPSPVRKEGSQHATCLCGIAPPGLVRSHHPLIAPPSLPMCTVSPAHRTRLATAPTASSVHPDACHPGRQQSHLRWQMTKHPVRVGTAGSLSVHTHAHPMRSVLCALPAGVAASSPRKVAVVSILRRRRRLRIPALSRLLLLQQRSRGLLPQEGQHLRWRCAQQLDDLSRKLCSDRSDVPQCRRVRSEVEDLE